MDPYHEGFWVVIGTAGPVVLLAASVLYGQFLTAIGRTQDERAKVPLPSFIAGTALLAVGGLALPFVCFSLACSALLAEQDHYVGFVRWGLLSSVLCLILAVALTASLERGARVATS